LGGNSHLVHWGKIHDGDTEGTEMQFAAKPPSCPPAASWWLKIYRQGAKNAKNGYSGLRAQESSVSSVSPW